MMLPYSREMRDQGDRYGWTACAGALARSLSDFNSIMILRCLGCPGDRSSADTLMS